MKLYDSLSLPPVDENYNGKEIEEDNCKDQVGISTKTSASPSKISTSAPVPISKRDNHQTSTPPIKIKRMQKKNYLPRCVREYIY